MPAINPEQEIQINNNELDALQLKKIGQINNVNLIHENIINSMMQENNKYGNEMKNIDDA